VKNLDRPDSVHHEDHRKGWVTANQNFVVPAWTAGTQVDMAVSGRILRAWMPAIHAGMTEAGDSQT
jgi:hypothetical protein